MGCVDANLTEYYGVLCVSFLMGKLPNIKFFFLSFLSVDRH